MRRVTGELHISDIRDRATLTVPEAGQVLSLGRDASYRAAGRGEIPTLRLGRRIVVPVPQLLRLLGAEESSPAQPLDTVDPAEDAPQRSVRRKSASF